MGRIEKELADLRRSMGKSIGHRFVISFTGQDGAERYLYNRTPSGRDLQSKNNAIIDIRPAATDPRAIRKLAEIRDRLEHDNLNAPAVVPAEEIAPVEQVVEDPETDSPGVLVMRSGKPYRIDADHRDPEVVRMKPVTSIVDEILKGY